MTLIEDPGDRLETEHLDDWTSPSESTDGPLFGGDEGGLSYAQRRCLVALLKQRYISRYTQPEHWKVLETSRTLLTARLNDLFLTLHVDLEREVAYKRQAVPDHSGQRFPTLLHDIPYNREETVLLVALRERLQRERAAGSDSVSVDREDLMDAGAEFSASDVTDVVAEERRISNAIASLVKARVLDDVGEDRFVISPVLDSLLPLERLRELLDWLRTANGTNAGEQDDNNGHES